MLQNVASDQSQHCLLKLGVKRNSFKFPFRITFQPTLRDNLPTSAVSALILSLFSESKELDKNQGPVVQSVISLMSLLRVISLTV